MAIPEALSDVFRPLAALSVIQQGPAAYYRQLRQNPDEYLVVGAVCALLDLKQLPFAGWDDALALSHHGAVRRRAYDFFRLLMRDDLARQAAQTPQSTTEDWTKSLMLAELDFAPARAAEAEGAQYLASGDLAALARASLHAESASGWREGLVWAVRVAAIAPLNPVHVQRLYALLETSARPDLLTELANLYIKRNMNLQVAQVFLARAALMQKQPDLCLRKLSPFDDSRVAANAALAPYLNAIRALRAESEEKLGHYRKAYDAYRALNAAERDPAIDPSHYYKGIDVRRKLAIPATHTPASAPAAVQMLGFPRSGTTLLENVLNAHPLIETFEEVPALQVAIDRIERVVMGRAHPEPAEVTFAAARTTYYDEIARRRRKPAATVLIDKMPIRSADADLTTRLFPEWRYIFAVRHPFDVVLSCFKQRFTPNPAMENFRTIDGTIKLYDFAMTEWFKHFTLDDPRVCYVRYDSLVTEFEPTTRSVLSFLGLDWVDDVTDFAAAAEKRAANTPSYQKVRSGLSLGVQTYWRHYDFIFADKVADPLRKWAAHFGYPTE